MPSDRPVSPEAAPPRTTTSEQRDAITRAFLTPDVVDALTAECEHVGAQWAHIEERIAGARVALARVRPPFSPETDRDGLYYPLLFLVEAIAEYQRDIDATGSPVEAPVAPSRASGAPDGTDRGAAMRDDELDDIRQYAGWEKDAEPHVLRAIVRQCVREIDRLRALSTGEPSPESAALRTKYELLRDAVNSSTEECSPACDQWGHEPDCPRCNPARWLEDQQATIVSLLARVAESARYAERYRAVVEFYAEADEDDGGKTARAALPPSVDTRGEQHEQSEG